MKPLIRVGIVFFLTLLTVSALQSNKNLHGNQADLQVLWPGGNWSFSAQPYTGLGYESRPALVVSVATERKSLSIAKVRVANHSSKTIAALKLGWYLSRTSDPNPVLQFGQTPSIPIHNGLPDGETSVLKLPVVVSFSKLHKPLSKEGRLEGQFRITVAVTEIEYEDGSVWAANNSDRPSIITAAYRPSAASTQCPGQMCEGVGGHITTCITEGVPSNLFCTLCPTFCCTSVCGYMPACDCGGGNS